jgi:Zn-dependent M16 (insulinase) family peptidase
MLLRRAHYVLLAHIVGCSLVPLTRPADTPLCLIKIARTIASQDIADVIAATETLKTAQAAEDSPEARATLPALSISDLDTKIKTIPIDVTEVSQ